MKCQLPSFCYFLWVMRRCSHVFLTSWLFFICNDHELVYLLEQGKCWNFQTEISDWFFSGTGWWFVIVMWLLISPEGKFFISRGLPVFNAKPWKFSFVQCFSLYVIKMESQCALIWKGKSSCLFFQEFPNVLKVMQLKTVAEFSLYSAASGYLLCRVEECNQWASFFKDRNHYFPVIMITLGIPRWIQNDTKETSKLNKLAVSINGIMLS